MTIITLVATVAAGLFAGASLFVTAVQVPAWLECGPAVALKEFGPSTRRAGAMQGALAIMGFVSGVASWYQGSGVAWLIGGLLMGALVPFTLIILMPINRRLLDPALDSSSSEARELLSRFGQLHAVRTLLGIAAFVTFATMSWRS